MIINMTTFAGRRTHYIHQTLESLFESDGRDIPLNLIMGSRDTGHIERYRKVANIVLWDQAAQSQAREGNLRYNCNLNAIRALNYGDDDHCLCCEDDITFNQQWFSQLMLTIAEIDRKEYVLNLGQRRDYSPDKRYVIFTRPDLTGAQAIFYPGKTVRYAVAEYARQNIKRATIDNLIGEYAKQYAVLYSTSPALIVHIGQVSSFH